MDDRDAAFLWETEALRSSPRFRTERPGEERWLTLRDAHERTGIPVETLRKWARRGTVATRLETTEFGERRFVLIDAVLDRAEALGREVGPIADPSARRPVAAAPAATQKAATPTAVAQDAVPEPTSETEAPTESDVAAPAAGAARTGDAEAADDSPAAAAGTESEIGDASPPETMIVPIAAWDKMLMQLGNLHEAGQQLAEARERAAKAETEAAFLRERLAEMRTAAEPPAVATERDASPPAAAEEAPAPPPAASPPSPVAGIWEYALTRWRHRRRRR